MMGPGERLAVFCNAERNARERAEKAVVEVDRREEWAGKYLAHWMEKFYGEDWEQFKTHEDGCGDRIATEKILANMARYLLPQSGQAWYGND